MQGHPVMELTAIDLKLTGDEAKALYSELYRLSVDKLEAGYNSSGFPQIAELMGILGMAGGE